MFWGLSKGASVSVTANYTCRLKLAYQRVILLYSHICRKLSLNKAARLGAQCTSGSRTSGDPPAVWAVMRTLTVRIQATLKSGPAPRRSGGRRLIAGRPRYQHAATCVAHFSSAPSIFSIVGFAGCQWGRACCCSPDVSIHEECRSLIQPAGV